MWLSDSTFLKSRAVPDPRCGDCVSLGEVLLAKLASKASVSCSHTPE